MNELFKALDEVMGKAEWPDRWMTIPQIVAELDRLGFWAAHGLADASSQEKSTLLQTAFFHHVDEQEGLVWVQIGGEYKHGSKVTDADRSAIAVWVKESKTFLNKQILALTKGKHIHFPSPPSPPGPKESLGDCLAVAAALVRVLRRLATEMGWKELVEHIDRVDNYCAQSLPAARRVLLLHRSLALIAEVTVTEQVETGALTIGALPPKVVQILRASRHIEEVLDRCPDLQSMED